MEVQLCRLADLSSHTAYQIFRLRQDVFIVEQQGVCQDIDGADLDAWHVIAVEPQAGIVGYCRLSERPSTFWRLQRVVVQRDWRQQGIAALMLSRAIEHARRLGASGIALNAQVPAMSVYCRQGFEAVSDVYDDGGTPHVAMTLGFS
jgi:ElaA protein